jgi:hypothetical protein
VRRLIIWFLGLFPLAYFAEGLGMALQSIEPPYTVGDYIGYVVIMSIEIGILAWFTYPLWGFCLYTAKAYRHLKKRGTPSTFSALKIGAKLTFSGPKIPKYKQKVVRSVSTGFAHGRYLFDDDLMDEMIEMGYFQEEY